MLFTWKIPLDYSQLIMLEGAILTSGLLKYYLNGSVSVIQSSVWDV